jgi:hypothetical protein
MWSGMPFVLAKTASASSRDAGRPVPRMRREQPGAPLPVDRAHRQLVEPVSTDEQQRSFAPEPCEVADHLEAELVGPLQVLEGQERRAVDGVHDRLGDLAHKNPARREGVHALAPAHGQQPWTEVTERGVIHRPREVRHGCERDELVLRGEVALGVAEVRDKRLADRGVEKARLADPCLAGEQQEATAACLRLLDSALGEGHQVVATDEQRALHGTVHGHRTQYTAGFKLDIGRMTDTPGAGFGPTAPASWQS